MWVISVFTSYVSADVQKRDPIQAVISVSLLPGWRPTSMYVLRDIQALTLGETADNHTSKREILRVTPKITAFAYLWFSLNQTQVERSPSLDRCLWRGNKHGAGSEWGMRYVSHTRRLCLHVSVIHRLHGLVEIISLERSTLFLELDFKFCIEFTIENRVEF